MVLKHEGDMARGDVEGIRSLWLKKARTEMRMIDAQE
jgi:hypothetical protein